MSMSPSTAALAAIAAWNIALDAASKINRMACEGKIGCSAKPLINEESTSLTSQSFNSRVQRALECSMSDLGTLIPTLVAIHMHGKSTVISDPLAKCIVFLRLLRSGSHLLGNNEYLDKARCFLNTCEKSVCGYMLLRLFNIL